ncbi:low-density lipoprotein receptor class A domain-containing protein 1 isoform X3 [Arvicanthis niloticus]|uniref:low-density lipoprotein receptor class A domain-containing protein 1 isoform X3 n=1 Tax=Arvicanthis niloticus TaxID=61156 RepID=UPI00402B95B4
MSVGAMNKIVPQVKVWEREAGRMSLGCERPDVCPVCFWSLGQADVESNTATGRKARPGGEGCGPLCCSRRGACLSVSLLLLLAMLAALLVVATVLGRPSRTPETHSCVTLANRTGFLCHDRRHCIPAHTVCDRIRTCPHGEDEAESLCRDVPQSLPSFLLTTCGDPDSWIYSDQKCDGTNNCGDCSDELSPERRWAECFKSVKTQEQNSKTGFSQKY